MTTPPATPANGYRLERLERDLATLQAQLHAYQTSIDSKLSTILSQLSESRESLPDRYIPRREYNERHANIVQDTIDVRKDMEKRLEEEVSGQERRRQEILAGLEKRIRDIEDSITWLTRLIIGAIITALITGTVGLLFVLLRSGLLVQPAPPSP